MRRRLTAVMLAVLLLAALPAPVLAAEGDEDGGGILDAIGDFFGWLLGGIADVLQWLLDGLKFLFIPTEDYFPRAFARLRDLLWEKAGGIVGMADYLGDVLGNLRAYRDTAGLFVLRFPENHLFGGQAVNLLNGGSGILELMRGAFNGILIIMTFAFCYKRLIAQIKT